MKQSLIRNIALSCALFALSANAVVNPLAVKATGKSQSVKKDPEARPGEFIVKFRNRGLGTMSANTLKSLGLQTKSVVNAREGLVLAKLMKSSVMNVQSLSASALSKAVVARLQSLPEIEYAEPNYIYRAMRMDEDYPGMVPSDSMFNDLWGMRNTGQYDQQGYQGVAGADIKAQKAWQLGKGSRNVVVAVIDTGVDYTHEDLKDNIWSMPGSPDVHGFNAIEGDNNSMDDNSHGTHCSGTIGAMGDNGKGVVGVNWNVSIMGVKFLDAGGSGDVAAAVTAIDWAVEHGAQVLSNSWGGGGFSQALSDAIQRAADKGIVFVAAAGNDSGNNNDASPTYPASYKIENVIAVAASNNRDGLADFSNIGPNSVHLMAPGDGIMSTVPGNGYKVYSGTSMATPHVAGAVALLLANEPSLTPVQIKQRLMDSSDKIKAVRRKLISGGRLNIHNLLANITPPGFPEIPDSAWSSPVASSVSTAHPYAHKAKQQWVFEHPGATFIKVHFAKFATEKKYDVVRLKNEKGEVEEVLTGDLADGTWSPEVAGSKITIEFESDDSVNDYGFDIDSYSWTDYKHSN